MYDDDKDADFYFHCVQFIRMFCPGMVFSDYRSLFRIKVMGEKKRMRESLHEIPDFKL